MATVGPFSSPFPFPRLQLSCGRQSSRGGSQQQWGQQHQQSVSGSPIWLPQPTSQRLVSVHPPAGLGTGSLLAQTDMGPPQLSLHLTDMGPALACWEFPTSCLPPLSSWDTGHQSPSFALWNVLKHSSSNRDCSQTYTHPLGHSDFSPFPEELLLGPPPLIFCSLP